MTDFTSYSSVFFLDNFLLDYMLPVKHAGQFKINNVKIANGEFGIYHFTLGPTYNEFGYYEHPPITSKYFLQKEMLLIDINVKKVQLQRVPLITSTFS